MSLVQSVKEKLETPRSGAGSTTATLRDLLLVTWAVPESRLRPHVPETLPLERLPGPDGEPLAFVQLWSALRLGARWSPLPGAWGDSFRQAELRALVRVDGRRGAFVLRGFVSHAPLAGALYPVARNVEEGRFSLFVDGDPARQRFERLVLSVATERPQIEVEAEAAETPATLPPLGAWEPATEFLTHRPQVYHAARVPKGGITLVPTHHASPTPQAARIVRARLESLTGPGILSDDELAQPLAAHFQDTLEVTSYPLRWVSR